MNNKKPTIFLVFILILPLLYALILACYQWLNWVEYTGIPLNFARINSYIYAHSYAVVLLSLTAGIQIGIRLNNNNNSSLYLFDLILVALSWLSMKSFADLGGMILLTCCWIAICLWHYHFSETPSRISSLPLIKGQFQWLIIILLTSIMLINQ